MEVHEPEHPTLWPPYESAPIYLHVGDSHVDVMP